MIKIDQNDLEINGMIDVVVAECTVVAREIYKALCEKFGEELGEMWLESLADDIRITDEEIDEFFYERMLGE